MSYREEARELVKNLAQRMSPSVYDIAWMARLDGFADLRDWLLEQQHADGSWGGHIPYYYDRIICTLAAMIALQESGRPKAAKAVHRAEQFVWGHFHRLSHDPFELVGFELLLPTLLTEARRLGLDVFDHACGYSPVATAKLSLVPREMLYSPKSTTAHSLEFLGSAADPDLVRQALTGEGSLGNSPAATAYYLLLCGARDEKAWSYLNRVRRHMELPIYLYPFRTFELIWTLNNLSFSGMPVTEFAGADEWQTLQSAMDSTGIGLDPTFGISDGDCTAVACKLLLAAGYSVDPAVLAQYETSKQVFRTYYFERNLSVGTNVHGLEALRRMPEYPKREEVQEEIIVQLLEQRQYNVYWVDKWHASPYYATAHTLAVLLDEGHSLGKALGYACRQTVDWLLHTQRDDGSWGFFEQGTVEETAYVLTTLLHFHHRHPIADPEILHRAAGFLMRTYDKTMAFPELWIGKDLFAPYDIIRAAILAALILYENVF